jgi:hypothetical protein
MAETDIRHIPAILVPGSPLWPSCATANRGFACVNGDRSGLRTGALLLATSRAKRPGRVEPCARSRSGERLESLRVFGRLPGTGARGCTEAGVRKASREETAGGGRTDAGVDLWGFAAGA